MPSKEPIEITLAEFAELSPAATSGGKGAGQRKLNWEAILDQILKKPKTNSMVFSMITDDKSTFMFDEKADDPNKGTIWTKLNVWTKDKIVRKAVDGKGNIYYGVPVVAPVATI